MRAPLIALALALIAAPAPAESNHHILPGYWESTNQVTFPIVQKSTSRKCITQRQVDAYLNGPSNNHYTCTYEHQTIGNGTVTADGMCIDNSGIKAKVAVSGDFTPTTFSLKAKLAILLLGVPIPVTAATQAHRISDTCPPDALQEAMKAESKLNR